ncbi:hypothetical protein [Helicobacter sp. T3_23-1056]
MKTLNTNAKNLANEKSIVIVRNDGNAKSFNDANHFVIASKSQDLRGTSPQLRSSDSARKREWAQLRKQNLQCNIDKIDCHANANAFARNDIENSFNDANHFVIASERSERGNLYPQSAKHAFDKHNKVDCHDSTLRAESRNDGIISPSLAEGARGWVSCHTERSEVSQNINKNRDISGFALNMTKKNNKTKGNNMTKSSNPTDSIVIASNDTHPQTPSAREGVLRGVATLAREGAYFGLPRATSCARNDARVSPSLAEGARGWVSFDSTADIVDKDSASVIASERSERGNLSACHTTNIPSLRALQRNAWQSTKEFCHTERSEVSQNTKINRDISGFALNMTKKKNKTKKNNTTKGNNMTKSSNPTDSIVIASNDTHPQTPSAREGAYFGLPRATSCARNDGNAKSRKEIFVIASERSERGNLQCNIDKVDCHEFASANSRNDKKVDYHANANAFARNDARVSPSLAEGARGWVNKTTKSKKHLAMSIAASAIIASLSIDSLVAGCGGTNQANHSTVNCSGNMSLGDLWNPYRSIGSTTYNISNLTATDNRPKTLSFQPYPYSPAGGGSNYLNINNTNASNSNLTVSFDTGNYSQVSVGNTRLGSLTVEGNRSSNNINIQNGSNIGTLDIKSSNQTTNISSSTVGTLNANSWVGTLNVNSGNVSTLNNNNNIGTLSVNNSSVSSINNNGGISNLNLQNRARVTNLTNNANKTISNLTITNSSITGKLDNKGTINNLNATNSSIRDLTNSGAINTLNLNSSSISSLTNTKTIGTLTLNSGSSISTLTNNNSGNISSLSINSGASIGTLRVTGGSISTLALDGGSLNNLDLKANIGSMSVSSSSTFRGFSSDSNGTIDTLTLGSRANNTGLAPALGTTDFSKLTLNKLVLDGLELSLPATLDNGKSGEVILLKQGASTTIEAKRAAITVSTGAATAGKLYKYTDFIRTNDGSNGSSTAYTSGGKLTVSNFKAGSGFRLNANYEGFYLEVDASNTYSAGVYRALALANMRRNTMVQNILDTMTTKTFRSDKFYNQEVELRLLQYEMSRITNRSSKFNKLKRKNEKKLDKVREKMARLTLEQSKGQDIDKGYNNFELLDQLDVAFIPYSGKRDWRLFALPYASHTYGYLASNQVVEYAVGGIFGVQRNLRKNGIFGGYIGYEFGNNDTQLAGRNANILNNSLNGGINYFKTFSIARKVAEGFLKVNVRGGVDFPTMSIADSAAENIRLRSNSKLSSEVLMYNVGAEIKGGVTFYQFRRNSYIAPEIGLSYDMLSTFDNKLLKTHYFLTTGINDEFYDGFMWHLPQVSLGVRYYKVVGNKFRFNTKIGAKYNFLNRQKFSATLKEHKSGSQELDYLPQTASATSEIALPKVYGNLAFDFIWNVKKNHEISLGYDGLFFFSSFAKDKNIGGPTQDWFNGVTTTVNLKYAYWFGGTDYKTDKDGNVVGSNKAKKSTQKSKSNKSKKKKEKKSKKKVYYIDG